MYVIEGVSCHVNAVRGKNHSSSVNNHGPWTNQRVSV